MSASILWKSCLQKKLTEAPKVKGKVNFKTLLGILDKKHRQSTFHQNAAIFIIHEKLQLAVRPPTWCDKSKFVIYCPRKSGGNSLLFQTLSRIEGKANASTISGYF